MEMEHTHPNLLFESQIFYESWQVFIWVADFEQFFKNWLRFFSKPRLIRCWTLERCIISFISHKHTQNASTRREERNSGRQSQTKDMVQSPTISDPAARHISSSNITNMKWQLDRFITWIFNLSLLFIKYGIILRTLQPVLKNYNFFFVLLGPPPPAPIRSMYKKSRVRISNYSYTRRKNATGVTLS